jgi:hypothetical protein
MASGLKIVWPIPDLIREPPVVHNSPRPATRSCSPAEPALAVCRHPHLMIALNVPFACLVKRLPRERFPNAFRGRSPDLASNSGHVPLHLAAGISSSQVGGIRR